MQCRAVQHIFMQQQCDTLYTENRSDKNHVGEKAIKAQWTKDTSHLVTLRIDLKKFYFSAMQFCCNGMTLTLTLTCIYRWFVILILIFHSDKESLDAQNQFCLLPNDKPTIMVNTGVKDPRHSFSDEFCGLSLGTSIAPLNILNVHLSFVTWQKKVSVVCIFVQVCAF